MAIAEPVEEADVAASTSSTVASQEVNDAVDRFKQNDFDGALKLLKQAADKDPDLPPPQVIMAQLFSQANVRTAALSSLEQAVVEAPDDPEAYIILGDIALRERRVTEAGLLYKKANELVAGFTKSVKRKDLLLARIYRGLASIAESRKDWSGAQKQIEAWLKLDPESAAALRELAWCLFQQKDVEGALEKLKEAAKADPEELTPEATLAQFFQRDGDQKSAKTWMVDALKAAPKDLKTRLVAAQWALETEQLKDAQQQAAAALKLDPKSVDAQILCGVVALFQKDYATAERYFEAAHLESPNNFAANNNLALALAEQDDRSKQRRALEFAQNNIQKYPRVAEAASTYGRVLYKLGRYADAEKAFQASTSSGSFSPDTAYFIAQLSADRNRESQAKQWLDLALNSKAPFSMRKEAKELLEKLQK